MNAAVIPEGMVSHESEARRGASIVLPGQTPEGAHILSVLVKRTYDIVPDSRCVRAAADRPLLPGDVPWGNPLNSTVRFESDFVPFKLQTDVVVEAKAYAPGGRPTATCVVAIKVAERRQDVRVIGDRVARFVKDGTPVFSDPVPFETMELRYERAYGGIDVYSNKRAPYPYPRNLLGRGFVVANEEQTVEGLALPNLEDANDLLTPARLCVGEYANWKDQPLPAGLGWYAKTWLPRAQFAGILPADRATEQELRKAYVQLVPAEQRQAYLDNSLPDMDFRFFNGASRGLAMPYLRGDEQVATANLSAEGVLRFQLPGERLRLGLDIGSGRQEPEVVIHTVMIRMEDRQLDVVWRGAVPYPGRDWLPQMRKMEVFID
jgi:hypothetical protein